MTTVRTDAQLPEPPGSLSTLAIPFQEGAHGNEHASIASAALGAFERANAAGRSLNGLLPFGAGVEERVQVFVGLEDTAPHQREHFGAVARGVDEPV